MSFKKQWKEFFPGKTFGEMEREGWTWKSRTGLIVTAIVTIVFCVTLRILIEEHFFKHCK